MIAKALLAFIIFPGFLFTAVVGLLVAWIDRKVSARVQWRMGPPWYQNFVDFLKLLSKETVIPAKANIYTFLIAPLIGITGVVLVSTIIWVINFNPQHSFLGDLIVILYLLVLPSLALILAGSASANPIGATGASREMKLVLAYELPFILAVFTPLVRIRSLELGQILLYQSENGMMFTNHLSSAIAFIVAFLCIQGKLAYAPFDIPEAETELMGGPLVEYSGPPLAFFKLTHAMLLFVLPVFLVTLFWGGFNFAGINILWSILKYVLILVLIILLKNTSPRIRIDQALKFYWSIGFGLGIIGFLLALIGL